MADNKHYFSNEDIAEETIKGWFVRPDLNFSEADFSEAVLVECGSTRSHFSSCMLLDDAEKLAQIILANVSLCRKQTRNS